MPRSRHAATPFARSLADLADLLSRASPDPGTRVAVAAAAAAVHAEFDAVVGALQERQALLQRLQDIRRSISRRAELEETLHAVVAGAADLLREPVGELCLHAHPHAAVRHGPADGTCVRATVSAPVHDESGAEIGRLSVGSDRAGRRFSEHERQALTAFAEEAGLALLDARTVADALHQAVHDALTGLPNRVLFADRVDHALTLARRRGTRVAVLFCDLDDFKVVNDSLGHHEGDRLLVAVAGRLRRALRASDTVARFGGDEFGILLEDAADATGAVRVAEQIGDLLHEPFRVGSREHVVRASIGIALSGPDADTPDALVRDADAAMYRAKLRGRGGYEVFDEEMRTRAVGRLRTEDELRRAIGCGELRLVFQPIVSLGDGRSVGAEALVRWEHPERGMLPPSEFIAIAEDSGLIVPMGAWVLGEACREAAGWQGGGRPLHVSVNISPRQIGPGLIETVAGALTAAGLEPELLALEITEGILLEDSDGARGTMKALKALGVQIVLDDFGTGYSSLGYLTRLPLDGLKIDRSFVDGLGTDADDSAIVSAVAGMAGSLGLTIIAEGVETPAQVSELRRLECQRAQGFHFARPMEAGAFAAAMRPAAAPPRARAARP